MGTLCDVCHGVAAPSACNPGHYPASDKGREVDVRAKFTVGVLDTLYCLNLPVVQFSIVKRFDLMYIINSFICHLTQGRSQY